MLERPMTDAIETRVDPEHTDQDGYDPDKAKKLAAWVFELRDHIADTRKPQIKKLNKVWKFIGGDQWSGSDLPSYRRPIVLNVWRRSIHQAMAVLTGDRPMLKIIPMGGPIEMLAPDVIANWQGALWGSMRMQRAIRRYADAMLWALAGDGGILKIGWGAPSPLEQEDWRVTSPHPGKVSFDESCTDVELAHCSHVLFSDSYDLRVLTTKFPEQGWRVEPDKDCSDEWGKDGPSSWYNGGDRPAGGITTIAPAGHWGSTGEYRRARAEVVECWIDDPTLMLEDLNGDGKRWVPKYPYGRLITCTKEVVLRDVPNPFGPLWGWDRRWPFIFVPGAECPHTLWRPGMLSGQEELSTAINKSVSLILENHIKVTNALIIADEAALDDEDWDVLSLVPGAKIRKRQGQEFKVVFPEPLPESAMKMPDYLSQKLEGQIGIQDPPLPAGQAVAARTVQFLQQKGNYVLGTLASLGDESLARLGEKVLGIMRGWYQDGHSIPYFEGEEFKGLMKLGGAVNPQAPPKPGQPALPNVIRSLDKLPPALQFRVEPGSAWEEIQQSAALMAQMEAKSRNQGSRAAGEPRG